MILSLLLLALSGTSASNVLVIVADDVGWTERSALSSLDALAAVGTTFERFYSFPTCTPARLGLTLGQYPRKTCARDSSGQTKGVGDLSMNPWGNLQDKFLTSNETVWDLLDPDYATSLIGKWHMGRAGGSSLVQSGPPAAGVESWIAGVPSVLDGGGDGATGYYSWWRCDGSAPWLETTYATDAQRDGFLSWWAATPSAKFSVLAFSAAHTPWDQPPGYPPAITDRDRYMQVVDYLNVALADVLAAVDLSNTFVIFISDNGTPDDARPLGTPSGEWKGSCAEGGVRVPMIIAGPGVAHGTTSRLVSVVDLAATIADLTGVSISIGFEDSQSFANSLGSWTGTTPRAFIFTERYDVKASLAYPQPEGYDDQCVVEYSWKLRHLDADGDGPNGFVNQWGYIQSPGVEIPLTPPKSIRDRLLAELASIPPRAP